MHLNLAIFSLAKFSIKIFAYGSNNYAAVLGYSYTGTFAFVLDASYLTYAYMNKQ